MLIRINRRYVIAAGRDNYLRIWSRQTKFDKPDFFRISMPPNILAIGISSNPLRIYVSTNEKVQVFRVELNAKCTCVLNGVRNIEKIRFQKGLLILCSKTSVTSYEYKEDIATAKGIWNPKFVIDNGYTILDSLLVHETKLLVLCQKDKAIEWQIYDYEDLLTTYLTTNAAIEFQPRFHWSATQSGEPFWNFLDTSSEGLCLISSESGVWVLNLMEEGDSPALGQVGNLDQNIAYGRFLRSCGVNNHQEPFICCSSYSYYLDWAICQKQNQILNRTMEERMKSVEGNKYNDWEKRLAAAKQPALDDDLEEIYKLISSWQSGGDFEDDAVVFPLCYHYDSGFAFVWNNEGATVSAVLLLDYTEGKGNSRFYKGSQYIDGYYPVEARDQSLDQSCNNRI